MTFLFSEYSLLLVYVIVSLFLAIFIFLASFLLATQSPYPEKVSPYECGFAPFDDARNEFDVRFYLVAILFLVFDLEASFLFPWSICLGKISFGAYWVMFDFFLELFVGFFYVWFVGGLDWELFFMAGKHFGYALNCKFKETSSILVPAFAGWRNGILSDSCSEACWFKSNPRFNFFIKFI